MSTTPQPEPEDSTDPVVTETPAPEPTPTAAHPDLITGEPGSHPVGVGVGALGAGAAGAALGAIGGPIGMLIGAAIGAVAGGLAGKEVASSEEASAPEEPAAFAEASPGELDGVEPSLIAPSGVPGEDFHAASGLAFAGDTAEAGSPATGTSGLAIPPVEAQGEALPTPTHAATALATGLEAAPGSAMTSLASKMIPPSGEEALQMAAYYRYLDRTGSGQPGDEMSDWLIAEREMMVS